MTVTEKLEYLAEQAWLKWLAMDLTQLNSEASLCDEFMTMEQSQMHTLSCSHDCLKKLKKNDGVSSISNTCNGNAQKNFS